MKQKLLIIILVFGVMLPLQLVLGPTQSALASAGEPEVNAKAFVLMDAQSGQILYNRNPEEHLAIASITKIMTGLVALEKGNLDAEITVGPEVLNRKSVYGTLLFLEPGEKFSLRDLLYALLMDSANDAAVAIAQHVAGSEGAFIELMNQKAIELGANDSHFTNPHGLSQVGHYSSARDMALITRYALQNYEFAEIVKTKERPFPRSRPGVPNQLENHNKILWQYQGADGVKTGYTDLAGHTMVASASRNGRQLIVVILKGTAITEVYKDAAKLFDYGFNQFQNELLVRKGTVVKSVQLDSGQVIKLAASKDIYGTVENTGTGQFETLVEAQNSALPVRAGEVRGKMEVYLGSTLLNSIPLVAIDDINPAVPPVAGTKTLGALGLLLAPSVVTLLIILLRQQQRRGRKRLPRRAMQVELD